MVEKKICLTKIVCTMGPASSEEEIIKEMIDNGMSIARLNFSHGTYDSHLSTIKKIKKLRENKKYRYVGIGLDTKGPEVRIGTLESPIDIKKGDKIKFTNNEDFKKKNSGLIYFNFMNIKILEKETYMSLDDGALGMNICEIKDDCVTAIALNSHILTSNKSVNFPGIPLGIPNLSDKDKKDIEFGLEHGVDYIFVSFVSNKNDVLEIKNLVKDAKIKPMIISKIESLEGIKNYEDILEASDGIMIARGDLGAEFPLEKVFPLQKKVTEMCVKSGKPIICATQMMESMRSNIRPTRAEVSDVGNAVLDGVDCVMLSSESASGKFPAETVKFMRKICLESEKYRENEELQNKVVTCCEGQSIKILAYDKTVEAIIVFSDNESIVDEIVKPIQNVPVIIVSDDEDFLRRMSIKKGCFQFLHGIPKCIENREQEFSDALRKIVSDIREEMNFEYGSSVLMIYTKLNNERIIQKHYFQ